MATVEERVAQRDEALAAANRVRLARAELKRRVRDGELLVADVVLDPPEYAAGMLLFDVLSAQRGWGDRRVTAFIRHGGLSHRVTLSALSLRRRQQIGDVLRDDDVWMPWVASGGGGSRS